MPPGCHHLFKPFLERPSLARFGSGSSLAQTAKAKCEDPPVQEGGLPLEQAGGRVGQMGGGPAPGLPWFVLTQGLAKCSPLRALAACLFLSESLREAMPHVPAFTAQASGHSGPCAEG